MALSLHFLAGRAVTRAQAEALLAEVMRQPAPVRYATYSRAPGLSEALAAGDDPGLYAIIADLTAGLAPDPERPFPCPTESARPVGDQEGQKDTPWAKRPLSPPAAPSSSASPLKSSKAATRRPSSARSTTTGSPRTSDSARHLPAAASRCSSATLPPATSSSPARATISTSPKRPRKGAAPCASPTTRRSGTPGFGTGEAHRQTKPESDAGEETRPSSPSPVDPARIGEDDDWSAALHASDDPELLEYQRTHRWTRQACGECGGRGFYHLADLDNRRWCAACDGAGEVLRLVEVAGEEHRP